MPPYPEQLDQALAASWWPAAAFVALIALALVAEQARPRFARTAEPAGRLRANMVLGLANLAVQVSLPFAIAAIAAPFDARFGGLLGALGIGGWSGLALSFLAVSLLYYLFHRAAHAVPLLWRLHLVHHADNRLDITTGFRHHPLEPVAVLLLVSPAVILLGLDPAGVYLHAAVLLLLAVIQHADLALPARVERALGWLVATPAIHHVHHSALRRETDSNFGEVLTVWDRLFGTFVVPDAAPPARLGLGDAHDATAHDWRFQLWGRQTGRDRAGTGGPAPPREATEPKP